MYLGSTRARSAPFTDRVPISSDATGRREREGADIRDAWARPVKRLRERLICRCQNIK